MGVGAFACYKLATYFPSINIVVLVVCSGFFSAAVGNCVRPAVACASKASIWRWRRSLRNSFCRGASSAFPGCIITISRRRSKCRRGRLFSIPVTGPTATPVTRYLIVLTIVAVMTLLASNLIRGRIGRTWMAVRDMDIAAELIGIKLYPHQAARLRRLVVLLRRRRRHAGVPVATATPKSESFGINQSFLTLFMVIIGGSRQPARLVSSARRLIYGLPIVLRTIPKDLLGLPITSGERSSTSTS